MAKIADINVEKMKFDKDGLLPVIAQDYESGEVLLLAYMNREALEKSLDTGYAHYYSRSKKVVSKFGQNSGGTQHIKAAFLDDDSDTLLIKVRQRGKAAGKKGYTTFAEQIHGDYNNIGGEMFGKLQRIIAEAKENPEHGDYTSFLFVRGVDRIGKKVGEEAVELVIAAKNGEKVGVINETSDLLYHVMVLLNATDVKLSDVCAELAKRNR